jgi:hypothetical protein
MDFDRVCESRTAMTVRCLPMVDHRGADVVVVVAKMAYRVSPRGAVTLAAVPVRITAAVAGPRGSLRCPSDYVAEKPGTDVFMAGTAYPRLDRDRPTTEVDVTLRVGLLDKAARVYGPRVYYQGVLGVVPGPPGRLEEPTPLCYENAFGGIDATDPRSYALESRNPVGTGFALDRSKLVGTLAPSIEDPTLPLAARSSTPAGFGAIGADWDPRVRLAGTFDERWRKERAPVFPKDFDLRHNCCAPPGLWSATPLRGDEPVEVVGVTPDGAPWRFRLPLYEPTFACVIRGIRHELTTHLDTFFIDADERLLELTWRAVFELPRKAQLVERIEVNASPNLPESVFHEGPAPITAGQEASA